MRKATVILKAIAYGADENSFSPRGEKGRGSDFSAPRLLGDLRFQGGGTNANHACQYSYEHKAAAPCSRGWPATL
ncbi:hypothetical protein [Rhizobium tropici]|uniref:hypothetical protein n=1 Tax=Rhizobium tropici TaxID=398 RepID=UPI0011BFBA88|nr:hypothetical protein [Rhizobium tropici]